MLACARALVSVGTVCQDNEVPLDVVLHPCGHLAHRDCLDLYLQSAMARMGKKCPVCHTVLLKLIQM